MGRGHGGRRAAVAALAGLWLLVSGVAFGAGPTPMPGFPMRAGSNVMLMWTPFPGATEYVVYRSETSGGKYQKVYSGPMNNFLDPNIPLDKSYYYIVKAVVGGKEGDPSQELVIKGIEPMKAPKFSGQLQTQDDKMSLRWEPVSGAAFYNLYRAESEKGSYTLQSSIQDTKYTDSKVSVGKEYFYQLTAVSTSNVESQRSETLRVKIQPKAVEQAAVPEVHILVEFVDSFEVEQGQIIKSPKDVDFDAAGNIYAVDSRGFVQKISSDFKYLATIGAVPSGKAFKDWGGATGVFVSKKDARVLVCFADAGLRSFDPDGKLNAEYAIPKPDPKNSPAQGWKPDCADVALGIDGAIWVLDGSYYQLIKLNDKGEEVQRVGLPRDHPDRAKPGGEKSLMAPGFLYVSPKNGDIFVVEALMQRVTQFDKDGKFKQWIGSRGAGPGAFILPTGVAVDENGTLYVGDRNLERVQAFNEKGEYAGVFANPKVTDPKKKTRIATSVYGVGVSKGRICLSDIFKDRVTVFTFKK